MKIQKITFFVFLAMLVFVIPASAQQGQITVNVGRGQSLRAVCDVPFQPVHIEGGVIEAACPPLILTATPSQTAIPSGTAATHGVVTVTRTVTPSQIPSQATTATLTFPGTPSITPTRTPTPLPSGNINPFAGALLCPTHNDTQYHGLWNFSGCHYDHTHNDDPKSGNAIFGSAGAWGQTISYPWQTPNENVTGHSGYKYEVNLGQGLDCPQDGYDYLNPDPNCIEAFRIQYHDKGGNAHMIKRFHSYYMEVQVQSRNGAVTGTISTGGHADFGCLHGSYKEFFILLPGIDPLNSQGQSACGTSQNINLDPYRSVRTVEEVNRIRQTNGDNMWSWTSDPRYGYNLLGSFFFRTLDSWGGMDRNDPSTDYFVCAGQPDCRYNNSVANVFTVVVIIPKSLDADGDGIVNYTGYTDIKGNIVQGCTAPSATCVPLKIVNAPVGMAVWKPGGGIRPTGEVIDDHDIYFNGQPSGWITPQ